MIERRGDATLNTGRASLFNEERDLYRSLIADRREEDIRNGQPVPVFVLEVLEDVVRALSRVHEDLIDRMEQTANRLEEHEAPDWYVARLRELVDRGSKRQRR